MTFSEKLIRLRKRGGRQSGGIGIVFGGFPAGCVPLGRQAQLCPMRGTCLKLRQRFRVSVDWLLTEEQGWETLEGKTAAQTACESARTASQPERNVKISCHGRFHWEYPAWVCFCWGFSRLCSRHNMSAARWLHLPADLRRSGW